MLKIRVQGILLPFFKHKTKQFKHPAETPAPIQQPASEKLLGQYLLCFYILMIILFSLMAIVSTYAQTGHSIKGRVTDEKGGPLPGALIKIKGTTHATSAGKEGLFSLQNVPPDAILIVSFIGYQSKELRLQAVQADITISLIPDAMQLEEVAIVSTGYQQLPKERATGSFAQVDNQLLNRRVSTNLVDRLEGVVPGLLFNRNTYDASTGGNDISVRGTSSIHAARSPLVVVDGFPYEGNLNSINPNDIESITLLKDAAAASIWGVRSGNGVIVVNTKKGKRNKRTEVAFNTNITTGNKPDLYYSPHYLSSTSFIDLEQDLYNRGYYRDDLATGYSMVSPVIEILSSGLSDTEKKAQIDQLRNTDVRKELDTYFYRQSLNQQYSLSFTGGGENIDYFFSGGYDRNSANLTGNMNSRFTLNSNTNFYPFKNLDVSLGLSILRNDAENNSPVADFNGGGGKSNTLYPYARLAGEGGQALEIAHDYSLKYVHSLSGTMPADWSYRPLDELQNTDKTSAYKNSRINLATRYTFFKGLAAEARYQYETQAGLAEDYYSLQSYYARNLINKFTENAGAAGQVSRVPLNGILNHTRSDLYANRGRLQLTFQNEWAKRHEINVLAGAEINQVVSTGLSGTLYGYSKDTYTTQNIDPTASYPANPAGGNQQIPLRNGVSKYTDRYLSYYTNAAYTYNKRYTLSASARTDKSNLFGVNTNNKAVPLYSAGILWDFSQEKFYHSRWLPYGRLRFSYGYNGNVDKNVTGVTTIRYSDGSLNYYSGEPYASIANPGNPELRWEKIRMMNAGIDFALKNNVLSGSIEVYKKSGDDIMGDSPLAPSTGLTNFRGNTADISGKGLDAVLSSKNISAGHFSWGSDLVLSYALDKVEKYKARQTVASYMAAGSSTISPLEGKPLFAIYAYPWAGLSPEGQPQGYLNGQLSTDYNAMINATTIEDLPYVGPARPSTFGSLRNTFRYKSFSLSFNIIYKFNYYFRRSSVSYSALYQSWAMHTDYEKRWQQPGDELHTSVPAMMYPPVNSSQEDFYRLSSVLVEKGDHVRLQDINLSYDITRKEHAGLPFSKLSVYGYVNNVALLWKANKAGLDPDLFDSYNVYPIPATFSLGFKAAF